MRRTVACSVDETYHAIEGAFDPNGVRQKADRRRSSRGVRSFSFTNAEGVIRKLDVTDPAWQSAS